MHINAFVWKITRIRLRITRGFCGRPIQKRHFWLQGSKGRCHGNQTVAKIGQKVTKNDHNFSCMQHIHAEFGFEIGFVTSGIHRWHSRTQGTKGSTMATNFGTRIAINAFRWETTGMPLLITGSLRGWPIWRRHLRLQDFKARCHDNQILAKIG